jgi:transcriptional regulator with XRE-family HTH domain
MAISNPIWLIGRSPRADDDAVRADWSSEKAGRRLRAARLAAMMTIEELADKSGVSVRAISDLERGRTRRPHSNTVRLLATALGLPDSDVGPLAASRIADGAEAPIVGDEGHLVRPAAPSRWLGVPVGEPAVDAVQVAVAVLGHRAGAAGLQEGVGVLIVVVGRGVAVHVGDVVQVSSARHIAHRVGEA